MRSTRQLLSAVLGALAFAALLLTAGPAAAHDAAESSSPADVTCTASVSLHSPSSMVPMRCARFVRP